MTTVHWVTAFIDLPPGLHAAGTAFWSGATGYAVSPPRGDHLEFTTLLPPVGNPFLKVQQVGSGRRIHLDLHVRDPEDAAHRAEELGAKVTHRAGPGGYVTLRSPGGLVFCFVTEHHEIRPGPTRWTYGHESLVDQVCLDIPPDLFEAECSFWSDLTGWPLRRSARRPEFSHLVRPEGIPFRFLFQRLDESATGEVGAHLDLATDDRESEVRRHEHLGATRDPAPPTSPRWTVMRDPTGAAYCITDRNPETGLLD
ncbi:hypothetical protein N865_12640 [Intrasporangium oryzae NRRL B-24470]|uniref:Glyoxalase-like domain-containing protein n=1 Tax=Intrasporangium oryzae NRRL B-24470 TaxID=1386089 RepID=W9G9G4_9MICO|nr:VOC family protein [Intrasporangium oryzae]EWT01887.1 hypothetical protein N865_12640 [Intrasporangium oryzae NRRL B-24470]